MPKVKEMTVQDIFDNLIGKKNAKYVLEKIQKEYDKGVRGKEFKDVVKQTIDEIPDLKTSSVKLVVTTSNIVKPPTIMANIPDAKR